jgi:hypothetical protein
LGNHPYQYGPNLTTQIHDAHPAEQTSVSVVVVAVAKVLARGNIPAHRIYATPQDFLESGTKNMKCLGDGGLVT